MVQGIWEGNRLLISEFFRLGYRGKQLAALNVVHCFCNLLHVSDITWCNRLSLKKFVISDRTKQSEQYTFPWEESTRSNFNLWKDAVSCLCAGTTQLPYTLGQLLLQTTPTVAMVYNNIRWCAVFHQQDTNHPTYDVYELRAGRMETRHGRKFYWLLCEEGIHPSTHYASVKWSPEHA